jgi:hypothetical protein
MPGIREVLLGHVLPGAICLIVLVLSVWTTRRERNVQWAVPIAIGTAFTIGYYLLHPVRRFPPQDQGGWLVFLTPVLMVLAAADSAWRLPLKFRAVAVEILAGAFALLLLVPLSNPSVAASRSTVAVVSLIVWLTWFSLDRLSLRRGPRELSVVLVLIALANAVIIGTSGSVIYGLQAGTLVAVTFAILIATIAFPRVAVQRGATLLFTFIWLGLLMNGHFWSDVTLPHAVLLLIAPHLGWLGELPGLRGDRFWKSAIRIAIMLVPLLIAGVWAGLQFHKDMQELGY